MVALATCASDYQLKHNRREYFHHSRKFNIDLGSNKSDINALLCPHIERRFKRRKPEIVLGKINLKERGMNKDLKKRTQSGKNFKK